MKKDTTLYKKVGKKYVAANDPWAIEGLREGAWLVIVRPGCTSIRQRVMIDSEGFEAACSVAEDAMCKAMQEKNKEVQNVKPAALTEKEIKACDAFRKAMKMGRADAITYSLPSLHDVIEAGINEVKKATGLY